MLPVEEKENEVSSSSLFDTSKMAAFFRTCLSTSDSKFSSSTCISFFIDCLLSSCKGKPHDGTRNFKGKLNSFFRRGSGTWVEAPLQG
eukprot:3623142-Amphidinium_carterae.1